MRPFARSVRWSKSGRVRGSHIGRRTILGIESLTPSSGPLAGTPQTRKECHPEYPRSYESGRRVDYALFDPADLSVIVNYGAPPDIIIESKPLRVELVDAVPQLRRYAWTSPRMQRGTAVLASRNEWWIYDLGPPGAFTSREVDRVNILDDDPLAAAHASEQRLGRSKFG